MNAGKSESIALAMRTVSVLIKFKNLSFRDLPNASLRLKDARARFVARMSFRVRNYSAERNCTIHLPSHSSVTETMISNMGKVHDILVAFVDDFIIEDVGPPNIQIGSGNYVVISTSPHSRLGRAVENSPHFDNAVVGRFRKYGVSETINLAFRKRTKSWSDLKIIHPVDSQDFEVIMSDPDFRRASHHRINGAITDPKSSFKLFFSNLLYCDFEHGVDQYSTRNVVYDAMR